MKSYELVYIISGDGKEDDVKKIQKKVLDAIEKIGGKVAKEDFWGKKPLAYLIQKQDFGFYVLILCDLPPEKLEVLESEIKLMDKVIRHLITKKEEIKVKRAAKSKAKKVVSKEEKKVEKAEKPKVEPEKVEKPKVTEPKLPKPEPAKPVEERPKKTTEKEKTSEDKERAAALDKKLEEILKED